MGCGVKKVRQWAMGDKRWAFGDREVTAWKKMVFTGNLFKFNYDPFNPLILKSANKYVYTKLLSSLKS